MMVYQINIFKFKTSLAEDVHKEESFNKLLFWVTVMMFNATFNNISVISVEETGVPGEKHRSAISH
jgi:hypothetical protein